MKTKIVEHIAGDALHAIAEAEREAINLRDKHRQVFGGTQEGAGLDMAVLLQKLRRASELVGLLT